MNISDKSLFTIPDQNHNSQESASNFAPNFEDAKAPVAPAQPQASNNQILNDILRKSQEILRARHEAEAFLRGE